MPVLVKFSKDYADEFDCKEFRVFDSNDTYTAWLDKYKSKFENGPVKRYFGTNEYLDFDDFNDFMSCLSVQEISEEEAGMFKKYFGKYSFGTGNVL